jgi:hypothetical protein
MGFLVNNGSTCQCSFGTLPCPLTVLPANKVMAGTPAATIMDNKPFVNLAGFGMCSSVVNPAVAAATAAAFGVLTPQPCIPVIAAPWAPGNPTVLIGSQPALTDSSKLLCTWTGIITITAPAQTTITL